MWQRKGLLSLTPAMTQLGWWWHISPLCASYSPELVMWPKHSHSTTRGPASETLPCARKSQSQKDLGNSTFDHQDRRKERSSSKQRTTFEKDTLRNLTRHHWPNPTPNLTASTTAYNILQSRKYFPKCISAFRLIFKERSACTSVRLRFW